MYNPTEKFDTLRPAKSPKRFLKSKILQGLGATSGGWAPFPTNTERNIERKILLQSPGTMASPPPPPPPPPPGLHNGLIAYWSMDENGTVNAVDATGNGWTAVPNGAWQGQNVFAFLGANGRGGTSALGFRQTGDVSANIDTRAQTTPFTFRIWVKGAGGGASAGAAIVANMDSTGVGNWSLQMGADGITPRFSTKDSVGVSSIVTASAAVDNSQWFHLVVGFDGAGNIWISINNIRTTVALTGGSLGVNRGTTILTFTGYSNGIPGDQFLSYDEAAYWNRSLSTTEVTDDYNSGNGRNYAYVSTH